MEASAKKEKTITSELDNAYNYIVNYDLDSDDDELVAEPFSIYICINEGRIYSILEDDVKKVCSKGMLYNIHVIVGNVKMHDHIAFFPLYLVPYQHEESGESDEDDGEEISDIIQIGILETELPDVTSEHDISPELIIETRQPIFYPDIGKYIHKYGVLLQNKIQNKKVAAEEMKNDAEQDSEASKADVEDEGEDDYDEEEEELQSFALLSKQTNKDAEQENKEFVTQKATIKKRAKWIQKFMKSKEYNLVSTVDDGDCFFDTIKKGLALAGKRITIKDMRKIVSNNTSIDIMETYITLYFNGKRERDNLVEIKKSLKTQQKELKKQIKGSNRSSVLYQIEEIQEQLSDIDETLPIYENMVTEFNFITPILPVDESDPSDVKMIPPETDEEKQECYEKFKKILQTCNFWANDSTIAIIEKALNIKLILFSKVEYDEKDFDSVVRCGLPVELDEGEMFNPEFYIMANYLGNHYTLITYKDRGALKYQEIPLNVKKMIVKKCMEGQEGTFNKILDFKQFMDELKITVPSESADDDGDDAVMSGEIPVFQFWHKSAAAPYPGKGSGEFIQPQDEGKFVELHKIKDWRKKLSNYWKSSFLLDSLQWATVEHYYQASKFKNNNVDYYKQFSLGSGSDIAKDPVKAIKAANDPPTSDIVIDEDFDSRKENVLKAALKAKFTQNHDLTRLLIETKNAKLNQYVRGSKPNAFNELMEIRKELQEKTKKSKESKVVAPLI